MKHELPKLPYVLDALEPYISRETLEYHYGKHHQAYVDNLNNLVLGTEYENLFLEEIIKKSKEGPIYNNAAQVWNHTFYFYGLSPSSMKTPVGNILALIERDFGTFEDFKDAFNAKAVANFGSGWTWLTINEEGVLEIINTPNAKNFVGDDSKKPLLTCDVWEHAYYIDTRNARAKYLENFWNIVNWDFVSENLRNG